MQGVGMVGLKCERLAATNLGIEQPALRQVYEAGLIQFGRRCCRLCTAIGPESLGGWLIGWFGFATHRRVQWSWNNQRSDQPEISDSVVAGYTWEAKARAREPRP